MILQKTKSMLLVISIVAGICIAGCGSSAGQDTAASVEPESTVITEEESDADTTLEEITTEEITSEEITSEEETSEEPTETSQPTQAPTLSTTDHIGVWAAYWDMDTVTTETVNAADKISTICHFAAYFDKNNVPFIPEETTAFFATQKSNGALAGKESYLTFVNDKLLDQGSSLKDTQLLYALFDNPEKARAHATQILDMTQNGGYDGIEIDYEAIKKDITLWNHFIVFVNELMQQANARGIKVRVLLEPNVPIEQLSFPNGPEYVMMCYNLYGYGTEPGPKANAQFLNEMVDKMEKLPGTINFALATGGYDFGADGSVAQLRKADAYAIQNANGATLNRDPSSQAVYFDYVDGNGMSHQVWFADDNTLAFWMQTIRDRGHNRFTIWRLGGNI